MGPVNSARTLVTTILVALALTTTGLPAGASSSASPGSAGPEVELEVTTSRPAAQRGAGYVAIPVPTSAAGLGTIVTAPNGDMWFTMKGVNKIGRITPAGVISEFTMPETTTGVTEGVQDLTVAADGTLWVVYDFGRRIVHLDPVALTGQPYSLGAYPYGEDVEMGPDGVPWVTMSFDEDGLARVLPTGSFWHVNAPPCDGALARANDGGMWCVAHDKLILSNADASGGTTYPLPSNATYPNSLAAGPTGSIWFSRYFSTSFTSPSRGNVGWIDQATGLTTIYDTGSRTGPRSLVRGPDNAMWFANRGDGRGIGHLHADGTGAITKVGEFSPWSLTFDHQGWLWFTDPSSNLIVRANPAELQVTDVEVGDGSVFAETPAPSPSPSPSPSPAPATAVGIVKASKKKPLVVRRNRVRLPVACPKKATSACRGVAMIRHVRKGKVFTKKRAYRVRPGRRTVVVLPLNKAGRKAVKRRATKVRATLQARGGKQVRNKVIRLRRR